MTGGELIAGPVILALGWSLVHFLWQGALIGIACWAALKALESAGPAPRYWVGMTCLAAMAAAPVVTFLVVLQDPGAASEVAGAAVLPAGQSAAVTPSAGSASLVSRLEAALPLAVAMWLSGVILMVVRLWRDVRQVSRLLRLDVSPVTRYWEAVTARLAGDLGLRRPVRILESARVSVPLVIGWLKPTILIPPSAMLGLTPRQLELIIAHELAHVRRADWLFNLFQVVVETVLFYHPAVRLLSRRIRAEREKCCDDIVVAANGDSLTYARALTEVEGLRAALTARMAIGASDGQLAGRVKRLIAPPGTQRGFAQWAPMALLLSSAAVTTASLDRWTVTPPSTPPALASDTVAGPDPVAIVPPDSIATTGRKPAMVTVTARPRPAPEHAVAVVDAMPAATAGPGNRGDTTPADTDQPVSATREAGVAIAPVTAARTPEAQVSGGGSSQGPLDVAEAEDSGAPRVVPLPPAVEAHASDARLAAGPEVAPPAERRAAATGHGGLPPVVPAVPDRSAPASDRQARAAARASGEPRETETGKETAYTGGRLVRGDAPEFPRRARTRAEEGRVVVAYTIDERGRMQDLEFTESSGRDFTLAVKRALKRWRFEPYALDGIPVARRVVRAFDFELEAGGPALDEDSRCGYATVSRLCRRYASAGNPEASPPDPHPVDQCDRVTGSRICGRDVQDQHVVVVYQAN